MKQLRITTYTRPLATAPATPVEWWYLLNDQTSMDQKEILNSAKGLIRANSKHGKQEFVVFELFKDLASMNAYNADETVITAKKAMTDYNTANGIFSSTLSTQL